MRLSVFWLAGAFSLAGCGLFGKSSESVTPEQLAKIPPDQMGPVNQARAELQKAQEEVSRTDQALKSSQNEVNVANEQMNVVKAQIDATKALLTKANFDNNSAEGQKALRQQTMNQAQQEVAQAQFKAADAGVDLWKAQKREAEAQRDLAQAKLDLTAGEALKAIGDPAGKNMNIDSMRAKVEERLKDVESARNDATKLQTEVERQRMTLDTANQHLNELRGQGGGPSPR